MTGDVQASGATRVSRGARDVGFSIRIGLIAVVFAVGTAELPRAESGARGRPDSVNGPREAATRPAAGSAQKGPDGPDENPTVDPCAALQEPFTPRTRVSLRGGKWCINDRLTNRGTPAEGLLMNVRMVNAI